MPQAATILDLPAIIRRVPCPRCDATIGDACWSTFLGRPMVNGVHHERRVSAATARPVRS